MNNLGEMTNYLTILELIGVLVSMVLQQLAILLELGKFTNTLAISLSWKSLMSSTKNSFGKRLVENIGYTHMMEFCA